MARFTRASPARPISSGTLPVSRRVAPLTAANRGSDRFARRRFGAVLRFATLARSFSFLFTGLVLAMDARLARSRCPESFARRCAEGTEETGTRGAHALTRHGGAGHRGTDGEKRGPSSASAARAGVPRSSFTTPHSRGGSCDG